jgi:hypothetical protein
VTEACCEWNPHPTQRQRHPIVDNPFALLDLKLASINQIAKFPDKITASA